MGRTLHYKINKINGNNFSANDYENMKTITDTYNSNSKIWSCENLCINPMQYYPNWKIENNSWDKIKTEFTILESSGMKYYDILKQLLKINLIVLDNKNYKKEFSDFVKTQGNELNSLMVYSALIELSLLSKDIKIYLKDEGEFLYCPVWIINGKVLPDISSIKENIINWQSTLFLKSIAGKKYLKSIEFLPKDIKNDFDNSDYIDCAEKYLNNNIRNLKEVINILARNWKFGRQIMFCEYNIKNLNSKDWFLPDLFHRKVDIDKFSDYSMSSKTLMDGFNGESFGLTNEDSEKTSYNQIALIQKVFGKENIEILGA